MARLSGGRAADEAEWAAFAARTYFDFKTVIPCHYRTFPLLAQDSAALRAGLPAGVKVIDPEVMDPISL